MRGNRPSGVPGISTGQDLVGAQLNDLRRDLNLLKADQSALTAVTVSIPEPCTAGTGVAIAFEKFKKGCRATLCARLPNTAAGSNIVTLRTVVVRAADATSQSAFDEALLVDSAEVTDAAREAGHFEYRFGHRLEYDTLYWVVRYVAIDEDGSRVKNPEGDVVYNALPLATFTTPKQFNAPSAPNAAQILFNRLDPTTQEYDAEFGVRVYAPLTDAGAAQTWGASGCTDVVVVLERQGGSPAYPPLKFAVLLADSDFTQVDAASSPANRGYVDITCKPLAPGAPYIWSKNIAWCNGEKIEATGSVAFNAAGFQVDPLNLTSVSLTITQAVDPYNPKFVKVELNFTQPATVVALKHVRLERKLTAEADSEYKVVTEPKKLSLRDDEWHSAGAKVVLLKETMKAKPGVAYTLRCTITAIGGSQRQFTQGFTAGADPDVSADTAAPSSLGTPVIAFTPKVGVTISGMTVGANWNQPLSKEIVIYTDTGGTTYFDIATYLASGAVTAQAAANATAAKFRIGPGKEHVTLGITLAALRSVLGASADVKCYFIATNPIGSTQSSNSTTFFNIATAKDNVNSAHNVNSITGGAIAIPGKQVFTNSQFLTDDGAGNLNRWFGWNGSSFPMSGATVAITNASANQRWDQSIGAVKFLTTTNYLIYNLKKGRILHGKKFCFSFQAKSDGTPTGLVFRVYFKHDTLSGVDNLDNVANPGLAYAEIPLDDLSTTFQEYGGLLKVKDAPTIDNSGGGTLVDQFFAMQLVGTLGGNTVFFASPMFNRGEIPAIHSILESEEGVISITPTAVGPQADTFNSIGSDGGWQDEFGDGGRLRRDPL